MKTSESFNHTVAILVSLCVLAAPSGAQAAKPHIQFKYDAAGHLVGVYNLYSDPANCGALGAACLAPAGEPPCCTQGVCGYVAGPVCIAGQPVSVSVTPAAASIQLGATQQFSATVLNAPDPAVLWLVNGVVGGSAAQGTIDDSGLFTSPASMQTPTTLSITAVSLADLTRVGSASLTLTSPAQVSVFPTMVSVAAGQETQFAATVTGSSNPTLSWRVNGVVGGNAAVGAISPSGAYTAPSAVPSPASLVVAAVLVENPARAGYAAVTITAGSVAVSLSPATATVAVTKTQQFNARVSNSSNAGVAWKVNGVAGGNATVGTISTAGLYTAPAAPPNPAAVTISATSSADGTKSAACTATVVRPIAVTMSPTTASVGASQARQFTATVQNAAITTVTWTVNGVPGGDSVVGTVTPIGLYTAPPVLPSPAKATVTAVATADSTTAASAAVTLTAPGVSVTVGPGPITVQASATQQFSAQVLNATSTGVTWKVNNVTGGNSTIGTISTAGLYTAPAAVPSPASVTVTAVSTADATKSGAASVTVAPRTVGVSMAPGPLSIRIGQTQQFTATVTGSTNTSVTWKVNGVTGGNSTLGTVGTSGLFTAPATVPSPSTVTISAVSAADATKSASVAVTVTSTTGVLVTVDPRSPSVPTGGAQQFTATVQNSANKSVTWSVNGIQGGNAALGTISAAGLYTAPGVPPAPAAVTIAAVSVADPAKSGSVVATVVRPVSVLVTPASGSVPGGQTLQLAASVANAADTTVTWKVNGVAGGSNQAGIITISGLYSAPSAIPTPGTVTVTATPNADPSKQAQAVLTVTTPGVGVVLSPGPGVVQTTKKLQFTAAVANTTNKTVTWKVNGVTSGNSSVGTISTSGLYTAPAAVPNPAGITISATPAADTTKSASAVVTVVGLAKVTLSPTSVSVGAGQSRQFTATVQNAGTTSVTWRVSGVPGGNATVGHISPTGLYVAPDTLPSPASVTVSAVSDADPTVAANASVTVTASAISVSLSPGATTLRTTATQQFTATVRNSAILTVTWRVNGISGGNSTLGTISGIGLYTAPAAVPNPATVTVSAVSTADSTKSAATPVTVTAGPPVVVHVSPMHGTLHLGESAQFQATVLNAVSSGVEWQVNGLPGGSPGVGTIDAAGLYVAPSAMPSEPVVLTAVAVSDPAAMASAGVTLLNGQEVSIEITPRWTLGGARWSLAFVASVANASDPSATWMVNGWIGGHESVGWITAFPTTDAAGRPASGGLYVGPDSVPEDTLVTITAVAEADPDKVDSAEIDLMKDQPATVFVAPAAVTLRAGECQQFDAQLDEAPYLLDQLEWLVDGEPVGSYGLRYYYCAPIVAPPPAVRITAAVRGKTHYRATSQVTITPLPSAVEVRPAQVWLGPGEVQLLQAYVDDPTDGSVRWDVDGIPGGAPDIGTVDPNGFYTAPAVVPLAFTVTVRAVSNANAANSGSASVAVLQSPPVRVLQPYPTPAFVAEGEALLFTAAVQNAVDRTVTWQVNGVNGGSPATGTIDASGRFEAPQEVSSPETVLLTAVSNADPTKSAWGTITITPSLPPMVYLENWQGVPLDPTCAPWVRLGFPLTLLPVVRGPGDCTNSVGCRESSPYAPPQVALFELGSLEAGALPGEELDPVPAPPPTSPPTHWIRTNLQVTWQVNGITGGNDEVGRIDTAGVYRAPLTLPTPASVQVTAMLTAYPEVRTFQFIQVVP